MLSKRLSTMLLGGAALAGLAASANAALVIDMVATSAPGGTIGSGGKTVTYTTPANAVGSVITFNVFANVTGADGDTGNEGILSFAGSFLSNSGFALGPMAAQRQPSMLGSGGSNGLAQDLDGDTDLDVGSNNDASSANFFSARSKDAPDPQFGQHVLVATATFTITSAGGAGTTNVNFRPRNASTAGSWFEDGTQITSANFSAGAPVGVSVVPEPVSLGMAGLAGLGMLARRRSR